MLLEIPPRKLMLQVVWQVISFPHGCSRFSDVTQLEVASVTVATDSLMSQILFLRGL